MHLDNCSSTVFLCSPYLRAWSSPGKHLCEERDGCGCIWGAGTCMQLIAVNDECRCPFSQLHKILFAATGPLVSPLPPSLTDLPTYAAPLFFYKKRKSSEAVHLQTSAANLTSHLYLSERRWAPYRCAAKSVFLSFVSNMILIPCLADMQMCEVMMCLRGFSRAVKMKCSSTRPHPSHYLYASAWA